MQRLLEPAQLPNSERHGVVSRLVGNTPNVAVRRKRVNIEKVPKNVRCGVVG